jgi:hypothetical protein
MAKDRGGKICPEKSGQKKFESPSNQNSPAWQSGAVDYFG